MSTEPQYDGSEPGSPTQKLAFSNDGPTSTTPNTTWDIWDRSRVLCLDGTGPKALMGLYILRVLMQKVETEEKKSKSVKSSSDSPLFLQFSENVESDFLPCHYFDYIAGTSTGGLGALLLGRLRLTVEESIRRAEAIHNGLETRPARQLKLVSALGRAGWKKKNSINLRQLVWKQLEAGNSNALNDRPTSSLAQYGRREHRATAMRLDNGVCKTMAMCTHKQSKGVQGPFIFKSYTAGDTKDLQDTPTHVAITDVSLSCLSNRSRFTSVKIKDLPGSFRDSTSSPIDPAIQTYYEVTGLHHDNIQYLLVIGSNEIDRSDSDYILRREAKDRHFNYRKFPGPAQITAEKMSLKEIREAAWEYCDANNKHLTRWAQILVIQRRMRARTVRWSKFAGMLMQCDLCQQENNSIADELYNIQGLQEHYEDRHRPRRLSVAESHSGMMTDSSAASSSSTASFSRFGSLNQVVRRASLTRPWAG